MKMAWRPGIMREMGRLSFKLMMAWKLKPVIQAIEVENFNIMRGCDLILLSNAFPGD